MWHKTGYAIQCWVQFYSHLKVKAGYGYLDTTTRKT